MSELYPLSLRLAGRRVLVVGGGRVGARRVAGLLDAGAEVVVVDPAPVEDVRRLAEAGRIELRPRAYAAGDLDGAWLVHACTDDPAVQAAVAADAQAARVWCVRADDAAVSSAHTPSTGHVDDVALAVTTGDPSRSRQLRDRLVAAVRSGDLSARPKRRGPGRVALVGGGPGDPDLITVRGLRLLQAADLVVADRLGPRQLLDELPRDVEVIDVGKVPRGPSADQDEIIDLLVREAKAGRQVVRLKGGDPFVFGRGGEELTGCVEAGVECFVVPGVSSALAVPSLAGIPLTHRGVAQEFAVVSGHLPPGHPKSTVDWSRLGASGSTLVLLMAVESLPAIADALLAGGRPSDTPVACIQEGTTARERVLTSTLANVAALAEAEQLVPPAVIVIGEVVRLRRATRPVSGSAAEPPAQR